MFGMANVQATLQLVVTIPISDILTNLSQQSVPFGQRASWPTLEPEIAVPTISNSWFSCSHFAAIYRDWYYDLMARGF
jgi:hypothetical protein